jgi:hypothetical protein
VTENGDDGSVLGTLRNVLTNLNTTEAVLKVANPPITIITSNPAIEPTASGNITLRGGFADTISTNLIGGVNAHIANNPENWSDLFHPRWRVQHCHRKHSR